MTASLILVCDSIGSRHQFGPGGGAFGRSRKCDWVLPDQDRHLSSVHARILYQNDTFILIDESTNGTFLEGQSAAIGRGKAVSLSPGMKLLAGPYQIRVESAESNPAAATNPFAGSHDSSASRTTGMATPLRIDTSGASLPQNTSLDPLDHLGGAPETLTPVAAVQTPQTVIPEPVPFSAPGGTVSQHDTTRYQNQPAASQQMPAQQGTSQPLMPADPTSLISPPTQNVAASQTTVQQTAAPQSSQIPASAPPPVAAVTPQQVPAQPAIPAQPAASGNVIPEDFLAGLGAAAPSGQPAASAAQPSGTSDQSAMMPAAAAETGQPTAPATTIPDNIDFGLGAPAATSSPSPDVAPAAVPSPVTPQATASPGIASPAVLPGSSPAAGPAATPQAAAPAASSGAALNPLDALKKRRAQREAELAQKAKSRADSTAAGKKTATATPVTKPVSGSTPLPAGVMPPAPAATQAAAQTTTAQATARPASTAQPSPPAATTGTGAGAQISPEVFQALLSGLGFADADVAPDDQAAVARNSGEMVRELANGLIALLKARKTLKTEFRMYETRIQPEENNPFKHFNVGELALDEMLFTRKGGFLSPPEAAKEAFKDLQSHNMLTVAATQRAMRLLFESLSPETLAGEEDDGGLRLRGLGSKRGKFEAAKERHDRLRADFDAVVRQTIAEAFAQVEEEQARQQSKSFWENRKK